MTTDQPFRFFVWTDAYRNVKERLQKDEVHAYGYHFRDEDFYLYMITHACKHYSNNGMGLRFHMDIYVYLWKKGEDLDWTYISREAERLGTRSFEIQCRALLEKLFGNPAHFHEVVLSEEDRRMADDISASGTYGTVANNLRKKLESIQKAEGLSTRTTRWKYYIRRLFPAPAFMREHYAILGHSMILLPLWYLYRMVSNGTRHYQRLSKEAGVVWKITQKDPWKDT